MKCPKCECEITYVINDRHFTGEPKKRIIDRPIKNPDGSLNIKNLFYMDPAILLIVIGLLLLLVGFRQINQQCYDILEQPCNLIEGYGCCNRVSGLVINDSVNAQLFKIETDKLLQGNP